ncbi:hypothetical protein FIM38_03940 [Helicobacter pylori]|nr:hypothetical protein FIM38_03940 [Helicobacter pylori]
MGGFDEKSFLAFFILVSGKLGVNSSGNLLKKRFFILGGFSWRLKGGGMVSNTSYLFKRIK